jgi:hypothetical protein
MGSTARAQVRRLTIAQLCEADRPQSASAAEPERVVGVCVWQSLIVNLSLGRIAGSAPPQATVQLPKRAAAKPAKKSQKTPRPTGGAASKRPGLEGQAAPKAAARADSQSSRPGKAQRASQLTSKQPGKRSPAPAQASPHGWQRGGSQKAGSRRYY